MSSPDGNQVLLTFEDVRRIKAERDVVAAQVETLSEKLKESARFLPINMRAALFATTDNSQRTRKWAPTLIRILSEANRGMTTAELKQALQLTPLADDVGVYGNALYNALRKMIHRGEIEKTGEYYGLPGKDAPPAQRQLVGGLKVGSMAFEIMGILKRHPNGLTSKDIVTELQATDQAGRLKSSPSMVYNVLARFLAQQKLMRKDGIFRLAKPNEPPGAVAQDGSETGSRGAVTPLELFPKPRVVSGA